MDATQELEMMKDGARRMQDYLKNKGLGVKHSVLLEAISAGFGSRNWRTVRDKLNAPSGGQVVTLEMLGGLRWAVHAIYCDNGQRYMGNYKGESPLEAQVIAQVERRLANGGSEIEVSCVIDRLRGEGADAESFASEASIVAVASMLRVLAGVARRNLGEPPQRGVAEAEAWDSENVSIEVFEELLGAQGDTLSSDQEFLQNELNLFWQEDLPEDGSGDQDFFYTDLRGVAWDAVNASSELDVMVKVAMRAGIDSLTDEEKICVYQAKALIEFAPELFDYIFASCVRQP
jgi:hypothetical protein